MYSPFKKWLKVVSIFAAAFLFISLIVSLISPLSTQTQVWAASAHMFHPGLGVATIDGNIETSEWAAADTYSLLMYNWITPTLTGTLYVLQSAKDLYLGFTIDDDEFTTGYISGLYGDTLQFEFDDNNSGYLFEIGENKLSVSATTPWFRDAYVTNVSGSSSPDINQAGGETNGEGMSGRHGSFNHYEIRFPLCSGDAYDFCLSPGDIIGLRVKYYDVEVTLDYEAHLYPGGNNDSLVTIEISDFTASYLPLIMK